MKMEPQLEVGIGKHCSSLSLTLSAHASHSLPNSTITPNECEVVIIHHALEVNGDYTYTTSARPLCF